MTLLWIAFALLLLPALWLLVAPLKRARALHDAQRDHETHDRTAEQNVAIYRRRLASLEAAFERGETDQESYAEDRLVLERSLLEDTERLKRTPLKPPASGRLAVPLVMLALVAASVFWYHQEGAEGDLALLAVQEEVMAHPEGSVQMLVERLEAQAVRQPDNPNVWGMLFPLYRDGGQGQRAIEAMERLIEIEGRHPQLLAQLAQIEFFVAGRQLTERVQSLVDETLEKNSSEPTVLGLLGIEAFDRGAYQTAIDHWRRAIAGMSDPAAGEALRQGIQIAQQHLGQIPEGDGAVGEASQGPGIRVRVSLAGDLTVRHDDSTPVFVVARDMAGELPPLAVARLTLGELPAELVLDGRHAMSPQASLVQVGEARLVVRVSPSGQAIPQAGDMFGERAGVAVGDTDGESVELVIDRVVE